MLEEPYLHRHEPTCNARRRHGALKDRGGRPTTPSERIYVNLFDTTQLGLERAMAGAGMRQATLAGNVANANTPGYQRRDVDFHTALNAAMDAGSSAVERVAFSPETVRGGAVRADGNSVDIDVESATMARNALDYEALVSVSRARIDILESAMGH
jgi:flagellar basal-body rod protein FlgB